MRRWLQRLAADYLPARLPWVRRWRGGHWELVDFDRLLSPFRGKLWLEVDECTRRVLPFEPKSLLRCEDHPP